MVSVQQAATYLKTSVRHVYYLISMAELEAWKIADLWRLDIKERICGGWT
jgi:excisionase family DNA binding protein